MTNLEKLAERIHRIRIEDRFSTKRIDPIYNQDCEVFERALNHLLTLDDEHQQTAFRLAGNYGIQFPVGTLRNLLGTCEEKRRESVAGHCAGWRIKEFVPEFENIVNSGAGSAPVIQAMIRALIEFGEPTSKEILEGAYEKFSGIPLIRGKYEELLTKWGHQGEVLPLPEKTTGVYARIGTGTDVPQNHSVYPHCPICNQNMICLFHVPQEAGVGEIPIFHCTRCVFHGDIHLQEVKGEFSWLGEAIGEELERNGANELRGGVIVWGVGNAEESNTFLGGSPRWAQSEERLICPSCNQQMSFILQLESDYSLGINLMNFYHGGIMYVFRCKDCSVVGYLFQTT